MKHFIIIVSIFFFINSIHSQDTTFNKYLSPFQGATTITNLIKTDSNYYALIGQKTVITYRQNYGLLKFDINGQIKSSSFYLNSTKYYGTDMPYGHGFIYTSDSYFLYCGGIKDTAGWVSGFLAKFDYNMDTIWTKKFYHPDTAVSLQNPNNSVIKLSDIKETPDGGYIIIGNYNKNCIGYVNRSFLMKLDSNGNIIWHKLNPTNVSILYDIEIDPIDSGFYYAYTDNWIPRLRKTDKFGNLVWVEQFNTILNSPYIPVNPYDIEIIDSNTLVVASTGFIQTSSNTGRREYIVVTSFNINNHTRNWEKKYRPSLYFQNITLDQSININITKDSNIVVSGTAHVVSPDSTYGARRGIILKLNQNGDSLWCRYYAHNWNDSTNVDMQLNDLLVCDDGGFLFGGFVSGLGTGYTNSWLVKTDSMGMTQAAFTVGVEEKNTLVIKKQKPLLYPNPAADNFRLRFEQSPTEDYELSIYSVSGKLVKQQQLTAFGNEYRVDIQNLKAGVYFVRLESEGAVVYRGKFIKN